MMDVLIISISLTVCIAVGFAVGFFWSKLKFKFSYNKRIRQIESIYKILARIEKETAIDRTLIFITKDIDKPFDPGRPLYVSAIYEGPNTNEKSKYQDIGVDKEYMEMLRSLRRHRRIDYVIADMEYSLLQRIYLAQGVKISVVFIIYDDEKIFLYGSFASHEKDTIDYKTDIEIDLSISQLQAIWANPDNPKN